MNCSRNGLFPRRLGRICAVFALLVMFIITLLAMLIPTTAAEQPPDASAQVLVLEARLAELRAGQARFTTALKRQMKLEIAASTEQCEQAIEDLKAEVELEIQQVTRKFEFESRQILSRTRRDGNLRSLKAELDAVIQEK